MLLNSKCLKPLFACLALVGCQAWFADQSALAQPRTLIITPSARVFMDDEGVWERAPVSALFRTGPQYIEPSGVRVGRGSVIPDWIGTAPLRNVSIRGLYAGGYYGYFVSPDQKVVILDLGSRQVARVIGGR